MEIQALGDRAFLARFATENDAARWAAAVRTCALPAVTDVVVSYRSAAVFVDPERGDLNAMEAELGAIASEAAAPTQGKEIVIPVLYDGPDLDTVANRLALEPASVIALHSACAYDVFAVGFLPGFPYAGYLPPALGGLPRRDQPRLSVPAGSVAIAGRQTGIYPTASPGGWHLLGRTPLCIAEAAEGYFPVRAGDRIRFQPIDAHEFKDRLHERL